MSIEQYPQSANYKVAETSEVVPVNGVSVPSNQQLSQVIVTMYKHGVAAGSEKIRVSLFCDAAMEKRIATGTWFPLTAIANLADYWIGRIGLTLPTRPWLKALTTYYVAIESDSYTRSADAFYLSFKVGSTSGLEASFIGLRSLSIE